MRLYEWNWTHTVSVLTQTTLSIYILILLFKKNTLPAWWVCCPCNIPLRGCPIRQWRRQRHAWPSWIIVLELNLELEMMNKSRHDELGKLTCKLVRDRSRFRNRKQNNSRQDPVGLGELAEIIINTLYLIQQNESYSMNHQILYES